MNKGHCPLPIVKHASVLFQLPYCIHYWLLTICSLQGEKVTIQSRAHDPHERQLAYTCVFLSYIRLRVPIQARANVLQVLLWHKKSCLPLGYANSVVVEARKGIRFWHMNFESQGP
jgi:hypothetical protein